MDYTSQMLAAMQTTHGRIIDPQMMIIDDLIHWRIDRIACRFASISLGWLIFDGEETVPMID